MRRIKIPTPPHHSPNTHAEEQLGLLVGFIWIYTDTGARSIETQYANAQQIAEALGVSRATAYRLINKHSKHYWCTDCRDADNPRCYSVIPRKALDSITVYPVGNPNFRSGIYQQGIARQRFRRKKR